MRAALLVLGVSRVAFADPLDACKARRHELTVEAMQLPLVERGPKLVRMPECRRNDDGSVEVIDPTLPPPPLPPFERQWSIAVSTGVAATQVASLITTAAGVGPFVKLEGAWHFVRRFSVALSAGFSSFDADITSNVDPVNGSIGRYVSYEVSHRLYDVAAHVRFHLGDLIIGVATGVEFDHALAFADEPETITPNLLFMLDANYPLVMLGEYRLLIAGIASYSHPSAVSATDGSLYGDVLSARLGLEVRR